jgi:Tfp pilus assembly protein PilF
MRAWTWAAAVAGAMCLAGCGHLVVLHDPLTPAERNDLGVAYEAKGEYDLAAREYNRALKGDPRMVRARVNLGNLSARKSDWSAAEREFRRALSVDKDDGDANNNLAVALLQQNKKLDEAEAAVSRALAVPSTRDSIYRTTLTEVKAARARQATAGPKHP